ncbi:MAG: IS3 family transposase [Chitinophagaceae bacterium]
MCTLLGYSRQAIHQYKKNSLVNSNETELIIQEVLKHRRLQPRLGTRKLAILLQDFIKAHSLKIGRDMLFNVLRENGLLIRKRRIKVKTTWSGHWLKKYPNLIKEKIVNRPNQLWVSDITYVQTGNRYSYLSLITDAYSRKIMGFFLSPTLEAIGCIRALKMALQNGGNKDELIHHSDRGVQYCSTDYVNMLVFNNIKISMTENGDPLENAIAERVNGILKEELLKTKYDSYEKAQSSIAIAIAVYNSLRPHSSCNMLTPDKAHLQQGSLKRHWKNYYRKEQGASKNSWQQEM